MKRIALLAVLLLAASCSITRERMTAVSFADFTAYPDMWISPDNCTLQHHPLGSLSITIAPAILPARRSGDGIYNTQRASGPTLETIPYDELLAMVVTEARARGANGISNLRIMRVDGNYEVSGLLVRIE